MTKRNNTKQLLTQITGLIEKAQAEHKDADPERETSLQRQQSLLAEAQEFDKALGPGLKVGRLVYWPQADGRAYYFVTRIGKNLVELAHFPIQDGYHSPVVVDGQALRRAVEVAISRVDALNRLFGQPRE